jgi:putative ABC transport system permease protein
MIVADLFRETIWSVLGNRVRSSLTILGIVIGIASVITMVAIGQGSKKTIEASIESIGSNLINVSPGAQRGMSVSQGRGSAQTLTLDDADAIKTQVENIKALAPQIGASFQIVAKGNNTNVQITGTTPEYAEVRNIKIENGSFFNELQNKTMAKVAVLGPDTRDDLFGENADAVGQTIRINGMEFYVIGITESKGGSGFNNSDDAAYVPFNTVRHYLSGNDYISGISITSESQDVMTSVQNQIESLLLTRHGISNSGEADFNVMNQNDIMQTASDITGTLTLLLGSIAGISLLVGGIGIMNMMLTTVTERTREIGLRKAVGTRKFNIYMQFLAEAIVLTFSGGLIGVLLGWMASFLISKFASTATQVSTWSILLAFGVSALVGVVFGFYPARRAANLSPIEALRYE